ncbi:uncharacterized protein LOC108912561 [Anoplophora glabripennis]|uniref:uncharacterized protein LOC108912561 n=1 Tax=Anoplophora glabripennis TaxID=217634 RepID=UPI000873D2CC|nr:uncharacterized protein LOC108912561 [Anoplophora glabripennis]
MGSPLSPVLANMYMEAFEKKALESTTLKPKCWKPTHTDRYLNAESHHHPAQKQGIINTLIHRARIISEPRHLAEELEHLRTALIVNGCTERNIERANRRRHTPIEKQEYLATTYLPYVKGCTDKIGRLLKKRNINTVFRTVRKMAAVCTVFLALAERST